MDSGGTTVADLVEAAAGAAPGATAVVAAGESLSYADLDRRANRLAHHLQSLGVGPDVLVGVCLGRSAGLAVALLGVLKAGGACVPFDPAYPAERLAFMAADAGVAAVLTSAALGDRLPAGVARVIRLDADAGQWAARPATPPARSTGPADVAYVIYTSGSTGRPNGVLLTHRGLVNHHRAVVDLYGLGPGDRVLQFCSLGFDASIEELFPTWAAGATVVFRPDDAPLLGPEWLAWLRDQRVTVVNLPTAYWRAWGRDLEASGAAVPDDIRLVVVGGERALESDYGAWRRVAGGRSRWVNAYGPTETTCMSTFHAAPPGLDGAGAGGDPPIGRPLAGTTVEVVDEALRPVAPGVTGELLIGGAGLARGYLNRPERTAERFVGHGPTRRYRTGDLVRQAPDGQLHYVGRIDDQVKIQGFRVECGEIEAVLAGHPAVGAAVVAALDDPPGDTRLVAYVTPRAGVTPGAGELRRFLGDRLPAHMVPALFTVLDALPVTPNGKVDRAALPAPDRGGDGGAGRGAGARSPGEDRVAVIWGRVLGVDAAGLGPDDDFFDLGGHSLLATQIIAQVREEFGTATSLRAVFEFPTLAGLAAVVGAERVGAAPPAGPTLLPRRPAPGEALRLSLAQEQMWALEAAASPPGLYNFTVIRRFEGPVDETALRGAVAHLVDRHEILRTGFTVDDGRPVQRVAPAAEDELAVVDLRAEPLAGRDEALQRRIADHESRPFELARPPLFRVGLFRVDDRDTRLAVTFDHLISDGTGASIFLSELTAAYGELTAGRAPAPAPLDVQFADFALGQRRHLTDAVLADQLGWWTRALEGVPMGPAVPVDHLPDEPTRRIASDPVAVGAGVRAGLDDVARATAGTVFTVVAAAVGAVLGRFGGTDDVVLSTTVSGRNRAELERMIGTFSGMSRLRIDLSGDPTFTVLARRATTWVLGMFEHQDIPFLRVRQAVLPDFPTDRRAVAAALPVELQYFRAPADEEFFFRGQLHPLSLTLHDGAVLAGRLSYKLDFYEPATISRLGRDLHRVLAAVAANPFLRLAQLPVSRPELR